MAKETKVTEVGRVVVADIQPIATETEQKFKIRKTLSAQLVADDIRNRFEGVKPIDITELFDAETGKLLYTDAEMKKKGCRFFSFSVCMPISEAFTKATHRETGEDNPFVTTGRGKNKVAPTMAGWIEFELQGLANTIWQNVVDNKREKVDGVETGWEADKTRANKINNYKGCRVIGEKYFFAKNDKDFTTPIDYRMYLNYVVHRYLSERVITDTDGNVIDQEWLSGFDPKSKEQKQESKQKEADKHGISAEFDPHVRNMKLTNIISIRVDKIEYVIDGTDYKPGRPITK